MQIEAENATVTLRKIGSTLTVRDAERMAEMLETLAPFSQLVLDFTSVNKCHLAAFLGLVRLLEPLVGVAVALRGLPRHEARLLKCLGLRTTEIRTQD